MKTYFATPDAALLLSSDGVIVARAPGLQARNPTREELPEVLAAAFGRVMEAVDHISLPPPIVPLLKSEHKLYEKTRRVFEKAPKFHEFFEFAFAIGDLMGWTLTHDPLLEQVKAMDYLLHNYFKKLDQQMFAGWSATRLAMLADVQALASAARETIRSIVHGGDDLQAPLTIARLALADSNSLQALNSFTAPGYWLRPYSETAINLDGWGTKIDDRAPVELDETVWDPRLALPTLLYALTVRIIVLKALHSSKRKYCHEIKQWVSFLLQIQAKWQTGMRRKLRLSTHELKFGAGFSVRPFAAGAVDVYTGHYDFIDVDADAINLWHARGFSTTPLPSHITAIPPELVAPDITQNDIDQRFETEYRAILEKQAAVAFTRLRWSTGLQAFSDTIKSLGEICVESLGQQVVSVYRESLSLVRESSRGLNPTYGVDEAQEQVELARALGRVTHSGSHRTSSTAMADRYALYCLLKEEDGPLITELRELVTRHLRRKRPWQMESECTDVMSDSHEKPS